MSESVREYAMDSIAPRVGMGSWKDSTSKHLALSECLRRDIDFDAKPPANIDANPKGRRFTHLMPKG